MSEWSSLVETSLQFLTQRLSEWAHNLGVTAGVDDTITELKDISPTRKHWFEKSRPLQPPKYIPVSKPPGCGERFITMATWKKQEAVWLWYQPSVFNTGEWYEESPKLAATVSTLPQSQTLPSSYFLSTKLFKFRPWNYRHKDSSVYESLRLNLDTDHSCQVIVMDPD